jgi:light-harvesting protein B-800-850 beta chain
MADPDKVYPSGLTMAQALELHKYIIDGTRIFFVISVVAHVLAYIYSPWLK